MKMFYYTILFQTYKSRFVGILRASDYYFTQTCITFSETLFILYIITDNILVLNEYIVFCHACV